MADTGRKIIHVDMDAFFASVEQRDFPEYRGQPVIVGGRPDSRGVVAACSYEARQYGIHSAMSSAQAYRLCPQAIFIKPRFDAYKEASSVIRKIFLHYTALVEPVSLDEAYLDVSHSTDFHGSATLIAKDIKKSIMQKTGLVASTGISYNKFLAKIASDMDKPDGLFLITPKQGGSFVENLEIGRFHGIGKATEKKMLALGINNGHDLKQKSLSFLLKNFGKRGQYFYDIAKAVDHRPVDSHRNTQSVGVETTFQVDIKDSAEVVGHLYDLLAKALKKLDVKKMTALTLTVKIKYHDFVQITRSRTLSKAINLSIKQASVLEGLLKNTDVGQRKIRLLGVTLSSLNGQSKRLEYKQQDLFELLSQAN